MSVTLRKKTISGGRESLYLDVYQDGGRKKEYLQMSIIRKPSNPLQRDHNRDTMRLAETICAKRLQELNSSEHGFEGTAKRGIDFLLWMDNYAAKYTMRDKNTMRAAVREFRSFVGVRTIKPAGVTKPLCKAFHAWLSERFNGETPSSYFGRFKKALANAAEAGILASDPARGIKNTTAEGLKKDVLDFAEIQVMANTPCGNAEVKRAFLFALNTGLRFCDIVRIRRGDVSGRVLTFTQAKTAKKVLAISISLNANAVRLLEAGDGGGQKPDAPLFELPSHNATLKNLRNWAKRAGITKHVTFHVARHSFATNLITTGGDMKTVSDLLGHTSMKHTQKYTRAVDAMKEKAVDSLPVLNIPQPTH